jgi:hypothetical protein
MDDLVDVESQRMALIIKAEHVHERHVAERRSAKAINSVEGLVGGI